MPNLLKIAVITGLVSGLLVGGFNVLFTAPVMARAIVLEEERAAVEQGRQVVEDEAPLVPLWVQERIGLPVGNGIEGVIAGMIFAGGYALLRRAMPHWKPLALATAVGALGFWALALFPFIKYPLNPPGIGDPETLLFRQLFQTLFFVVSAGGVVGLLIAIRRVNAGASEKSTRLRLNGIVFLVYGLFALIIVFAFPGNPDPVPVPIDLLELFRTLTMIGKFMLWALLAAGVALALTWYGRSDSTNAANRATATSGQSPEKPTR